MKFSTSTMRAIEEKDKESLDVFIRKLKILNPNSSFKHQPEKLFYIRSSLNTELLPSISLPTNAFFIEQPYITSKYQGFVIVKYNDREYYIFAEGDGGLHCIL